jgi:hypothetical protein
MANISKITRELDLTGGKDIPKEITQHNEPIILRGVVKDWNLVRLADRSSHAVIDYLKSIYNGKPSLVNVGHPGIKGRYFYGEDLRSLNYDTVKMQVNEALDLILASEADPSHPSIYLTSNTVGTHFTNLSNELNLNLPRAEVTYPTLPPDVRIWIGTRSIATCHFDALDNVACCVAGRRRFTLFPPSQFENLYFGPLDPTPGGQAISMVDFDNPDYQLYPRFKLAESEGQVAELEPGDGLFIPSMWMHHVEGLNDFNILVNFWWNDAPIHTGSAMNVLYHALLSLRDKPAHEKEGWKHIFNYYVFGEPGRAAEHLPESAQGFLGSLDEVAARKLRALVINKLNR